MALSLLTGALALRPASQTALAAPPETPPGGLVENAQYQQVLAVAASQELGRLGGWLAQSDLYHDNLYTPLLPHEMSNHAE